MFGATSDISSSPPSASELESGATTVVASPGCRGSSAASSEGAASTIAVADKMPLGICAVHVVKSEAQAGKAIETIAEKTTGTTVKPTAAESEVTPTIPNDANTDEATATKTAGAHTNGTTSKPTTTGEAQAASTTAARPIASVANANSPSKPRDAPIPVGYVRAIPHIAANATPVPAGLDLDTYLAAYKHGFSHALLAAQSVLDMLDEHKAQGFWEIIDEAKAAIQMLGEVHGEHGEEEDEGEGWSGELELMKAGRGLGRWG